MAVLFLLEAAGTKIGRYRGFKMDTHSRQSPSTLFSAMIEIAWSVSGRRPSEAGIREHCAERPQRKFPAADRDSTTLSGVCKSWQTTQSVHPKVVIVVVEPAIVVLFLPIHSRSRGCRIAGGHLARNW